MNYENPKHENNSNKNENREKDEFLIAEIPYSQDQSPEFDEYLKSRPFVEARRDSFSKPTKMDLLFSGWHVPCHAIITRDKEGMCQAFHVQPNKMSASFLTPEQLAQLEALRDKEASAIATRGERSWFGRAGVKELQNLKINHQRTIEVDSSNWWRLLYDPKTNEIWIDIKDKKVLRKYIGF